MLIAAQKYQENIAEYVLYMWHLEDMLRACEFDMDLIHDNLILPQVKDGDMLTQVVDWYTQMVKRMEIEKITRKGHLSEVNEVVIEMLYLHNSLLNITRDKAYEDVFRRAQVYIKEFAGMTNTGSLNPIETCLNAQYAKLLLKLQKKEISPESEEAFNAFRQVLAYISIKYKEMKTGAFTAMSN